MDEKKKKHGKSKRENRVSAAHRGHYSGVIKMTTKKIIEDQSESHPWRYEAPIKK